MTDDSLLRALALNQVKVNRQRQLDYFSKYCIPVDGHTDHNNMVSEQAEARYPTKDLIQAFGITYDEIDPWLGIAKRRIEKNAKED